MRKFRAKGPHHVLKNEEHLIVFSDDLLQLYNIGMAQFTKDLEKAYLFTSFNRRQNYIRKLIKNVCISRARERDISI